MLKLMKIVKVEGVNIFYLPTVISTIFILIQATVSRKGNVWVCFTVAIFLYFNAYIIFSIIEFFSFSLNIIFDFLGYVYWSIYNEMIFYMISN